jgi:hypothetical protein
VNSIDLANRHAPLTKGHRFRTDSAVMVRREIPHGIENHVTSAMRTGGSFHVWRELLPEVRDSALAVFIGMGTLPAESVGRLLHR